MIRIILTGLDFDVLLPITDITGRQAYFSLITSNSCDLHGLGTAERCACVRVVCPCVSCFITWPSDISSMMPVCVFKCADIFLSCKISIRTCSIHTGACCDPAGLRLCSGCILTVFLTVHHKSSVSNEKQWREEERGA